MAGELPEYAAWIRRQSCAACGLPGPCEPHHATNGSTVPFGERPTGKLLGGKRGKGQKAHDSCLVPCPVCGQPGVLDRPELGAVQATCTACGWHYTPRLYAEGRLALLLALELAASYWRDNPDDELLALELCRAVDALRAPATIMFEHEPPAPGAPSPHEEPGPALLAEALRGAQSK